MGAGRERNTKLSSFLAACRWSYDDCAAAVRAVARESGEDSPALSRSHVAKWISGVRPREQTARHIAEAVARRLGSPVSLVELGLSDEVDAPVTSAGHHGGADPVVDLVTVGRADMERRDFAKTALYSLGALAVPLNAWQDIADRGQRAASSGASIGDGELKAVRRMVATFTSSDELFGGGHARIAVVAYLSTDVAAYLHGSFQSDETRRKMFSAAAELAYLAGWKSFDSGNHGVAQKYYLTSLRLANEADDAPLAGFVLRAMAHQAVDLGHGNACVKLAESALDWSKKTGTPGASALFTVVKARGFAADHQKRATTDSLKEAETLLGKVEPAAEPLWITRMGFGEPSLANQTAQALRDLGDNAESERQFKRSISTRDGASHRRIQALTLAKLADVQFARGRLAEACRNWKMSMHEMDGIHSHRAAQSVVNLRQRIATLGPRRPKFADELDTQAAALLDSLPATY